MKKVLFGILLCLLFVGKLAAQSLPVFTPEKLGFNTLKLNNIDRIVNKAIAEDHLPGAVVAVVKKDKIAYLKAFGHQQLYPSQIPMDVHTIFDMASVTKPLATAISTFILLERGELSLQDPVNMYLPEFENSSIAKDKAHIRIKDLLLHQSGMPAYAPVSSLTKGEGNDYAIRLKDFILNASNTAIPEENMVYSCLNYILLQYIIEGISGESLDVFTTKNIYAPLKLATTQFKPSSTLRDRCASTEIQPNGEWLKGEVHDPLARVMNHGVSGNAGLFSTAPEVATLAALFLNDGMLNGKHILSPESIRKMSKIPFGFELGGRSFGWDVNSPYSWNQGDLTFDSSIGHTGFTGTSVVIDQKAELAIVILTNKLHAKESVPTHSLFQRIVNIVEAANGTATNESHLKHYAMRLDHFKDAQAVSSKDLVMLGDSQIENGGDWAKRLQCKHVVNRGIIGDTAEGILERLDDIILGQPKQLLLAVGINDISQGLNRYTLIDNIQRIIHRIKKESPKTGIYLQSILPFNEKKSFYSLLKGKSAYVEEINAELAKLALAEGIPFIDLYPYFVEDSTNQLKSDWTNDGLHLKEDGYKQWAEILKDNL